MYNGPKLSYCTRNFVTQTATVTRTDGPGHKDFFLDRTSTGLHTHQHRC